MHISINNPIKDDNTSKTEKGYTSLLETEVYPITSTEAFTPVFPTNIKMGKLFKIKASSQSYNKSVLMLKKFRSVAFVPLVTSRDDIAKEIKLCFGEDLYKRMMYNYIFIKKFRYKNILLPGSKTYVVQNDIATITDDVKRILPNLQSLPSYVMRNNKNTIFDYSDLLSLCWPTSELLIKPSILPSSQDIILQILYRLVFGNLEGQLPLFNNLLLANNTVNVSDNFDSIFVSIPIESKNVQVASMYMNPKIDKIPIAVRRNVNDSIALGISRFIVDLLDNKPFENSNLKKVLSEKIGIKNNFIFFIHNENYGFYVDPIEFKDKNLKFPIIYRMIKASMKALLANNANDIDSIEVDNVFSDKNIDDDIDAKVDNALKINSRFDDSVRSIIKSSDELSKKTIFISKKDKSSLTDEDKKKKELDTLMKTQSNNIKNKEKIKLKKEAEEENILNDLNSDDFNFDDIDDKLDIELEDTETEQTEDNITNIREFMDDVKESNSEFIKEKIVEEAQKSMAPKLTEKQKARLEELRNKYKSIKFDEDRTFDEILKDTEALQIDINKNNKDIKDDSYNYSILKDMTSSYVNKTMAYDMINIIKSLSEDKSINMNIVDFKKEDISDQFNELEMYTFNLEGDDKRKHKVQFKFPKVTEDGFMYLNGNKKILKKQWILKPITKTSPDEVYLVSDYNKTHIFRQGKDLNRNTVSLKKLVSAVMSDPEKVDTMKIIRGDNSMINGNYITTIEYDDMSKFLDKIIIYKQPKNGVIGSSSKKVIDTAFYFNQKEIRSEIEALKIPYEIKNDRLPIGIKDNIEVIDASVTDSYDSVALKILSHIKSANAFEDFDKFMKTITIPKRKMFTRIELQSKSVPLVVFLSALFTFTKVLEKLKADYFTIDIKEKFPADKNFNDYNEIKFKDKKFYYNQYPVENALMLNGLAELDTPNITLAELDELGTYLDYIYNTFKIRSLYKGWTAFKELFLTPITKEILRDLKQPTDFLELFIYANSLLSDNDFLPPNDARNYRIRDYEMLNSYLYESISESYRNYKQKGKQRFAFTIPEDDIIKKLNKSLVLENYDATNPLNELKAKSAITYKGPQGVNTDRAFKLERRGQTRSMVGIVGISNPENSTVGITRQLTLNPPILSTRGYLDVPVTDDDVRKIPAASLLAAEEAVLPYITRDDPKRIGFATAQTKHVIPADNFDFPVVGTGFEQTVLNRIGDDFGHKAKKDGVVSAIDDTNKFVIIKYKDGTSERVDYGAKYMRNSDFFLANNLDVNVKVGDSVKKGDIVTYNKDFFKKHLGKLMFTQGVLAKVAILEGEMTEEDSSCITSSLAEKLSGTVIKRKQIVLGANSNIVKSVKLGDFVRYGDPLILYEDQKNEEADLSLLELLGQVDDSILDKLTRHNGEANYTGVISDIKVYWTIDPDHMSDSIKKFVKQYIKNIKAQIDFEEKSTGVESVKRHDIEVTVPSGNGNRINGMSIPKEGGVLIEYYIKHNANKRGGDKITVNSSLKSVITQIIPDEYAAQRCVDTKFKDIDVIFSLISVDNRMVTSIWHTGYLQKILFEYPKRLANEFLEKLKTT